MDLEQSVDLGPTAAKSIATPAASVSRLQMTANRAELLLDDQSSVLRRLMSYNSAVAVSTVISQAESLRRRGHISPPLVGRLYPSLAPFSSGPSDATSAQREVGGKGGVKAGTGDGPGATHVSLSGGNGGNGKDVPYWLKGVKRLVWAEGMGAHGGPSMN